MNHAQRLQVGAIHDELKMLIAHLVQHSYGSTAAVLSHLQTLTFWDGWREDDVLIDIGRLASDLETARGMLRPLVSRVELDSRLYGHLEITSGFLTIVQCSLKELIAQLPKDERNLALTHLERGTKGYIRYSGD